jgi:hypothetical protein
VERRTLDARGAWKVEALDGHPGDGVQAPKKC